MRAILPLLLLAMGAAPCCAQMPDTLVFQLQGTVYDKTTGAVIPGAKVEVMGTDGSSFSALTDKNGGFTFAANGKGRCINPNTTYSILATAEEHINVTDQLTTVGVTENTTFVKEYYLIHVISEYPPPVIYFEQRSAKLDSAGRANADTIVSILKENPTLVIELRGHADNQEDSTLAMKRCTVVKQYMIKQGIVAKHLTVRSYGARDPVITTKEIGTLKTKDEVQQALARNRRVDFRVVGY